MSTKDRKKIQINIDKQLAEEVDAILDELGLNQTVLVTSLYKKVAATGGVPFDYQLSERQRAILALKESTKKVPTKKIESAEELEEWLAEE